MIQKRLVIKSIEDELSKAPKEWICQWKQGELSLVKTFILPYIDEIRKKRRAVLKIVRSLTVEDIKEAFVKARPEFSDLWNSEKFNSKIEKELKELINYINKL